MPNRTEARSAKAALTNATGRLPLLRLFSTLLKTLFKSTVNLDVIAAACSRCDSTRCCGGTGPSTSPETSSPPASWRSWPCPSA